MNDSDRSSELESEIERLEGDLDHYSWNVRELSNNERRDIKELYKMWKTCINKKIIIDDIQNTNVRVNNKIMYYGKVFWDDVRKHHSLHFANCSDITIIITSRVNHITLDRCSNINIRTTGGSISGIDLIKCCNVTCIFESNNVNYMDISDTTQCSFILSESIAKNIMITTTCSYNLSFKTICDNSGITKSIYKTNMNVFQNYAMYTFHDDLDGKLSLYIVVPNSDIIHLVSPIN